MAIKTTNVYYYQLSSKDQSLDPEKKDLLLKKADETIFSKKEKYFSVPHSHGHANLHHITERNNRYVLGTFVYNQKLDIPPAYDEAEQTASELNIGDFQGLGYDSSFIYDTVTRIIALESKSPGVTMSTVEKFIKSNYGIEDCNFKFVLLPNEFERFLKSSEATKVELDISIPNNLKGVLNSNNGYADDFIRMFDDLNSVSGKFTISVGRSRKQKLNFKSLKNFVISFMDINKSGHDIVRDLKVTAQDIDREGSHVFDLISNRLKTKISMEIKQRISKFEIKEKYDQLEGSYLSYREQLEKIRM